MCPGSWAGKILRTRRFKVKGTRISQFPLSLRRKLRICYQNGAPRARAKRRGVNRQWTNTSVRRRDYSRCSRSWYTLLCRHQVSRWGTAPERKPLRRLTSPPRRLEAPNQSPKRAPGWLRGNIFIKSRRPISRVRASIICYRRLARKPSAMRGRWASYSG